MARIRYIKPQFFDNYELAQLDPYARLLFISIWCQADREGRLKDEPERIKARSLPFNKVNVNKLLDLLSTGGESWLIRYEANGIRYIQVRNWKKHQHPHVKEPASTIPAPCSTSAELVQAPGQALYEPGARASGNGEWGMGNGVRATDNDMSALFLALFHAYPEHRRDKSHASQSAFVEIMAPLTDEDRPILHAKILDGIERAKASDDWRRNNGQYVPHLKKFLAEMHWTREYRSAVKPETQAERVMRLLEERERQAAQ